MEAMSNEAWCCFCGNPKPKCGLHLDPMFGVPACSDQDACWAWGVRRVRQVFFTRLALLGVLVAAAVAVPALWVTW